uniref:G-protein coupled receptors family 1 profile domain-containing protein n=1 Tax=Anabas testudineus TaxID=64144 RepID=A0AAQ6IMM7_ANATE
MITEVVTYKEFFEIFAYMHLIGLMASVCFMVCIALERYLVIAWPLWYRNRRTIKSSVAVCVVVWAIPIAYILPGFFWDDSQTANTFFGVFLLLPYPLLIFFMAGTFKALSAAISVPPDEKRRIVGLLVLVLLIYTLLFLPNAIWSLIKNAQRDYYFTSVSFYILKFSPLADLLLYVFLRKGAVDKLLVSLCCWTKDSDGISRTTLSAV